MTNALFENSAEDMMSQALYELNKEVLTYRAIETKRNASKFSLRNMSILFSYIKNGAFQRILRRIRVTSNNSDINNNYKLKCYDCFPKCRVVVYTCIWGRYDDVIEPLFTNPNIDYFIITDQNIQKTSKWKRRDISEVINTNDMTPLEVNRFCKMLPHILFPEYDYSIYVDGNIRIVTDMMPIIADMGESVLGIHDYQVNCIYNMKDAIIAGKRAKKEAVEKQIAKYKKAGFPKDFGAFECNVLVRKHMDDICSKLMEQWWEEFNTTSSKRDQLSLPYVLWKNYKNASLVYSLGNNVRLNPRFQVEATHKV